MKGIIVNFVLMSAEASEIDRLRRSDVSENWSAFRSGEYNWVLQAFLRLNQKGYPCRLSKTLEPDCMNIAANSMLRQLKRIPRGLFVVGVRADYPRVAWVDAEIVQNKSQITDRCFWLPHFPQPGLIPRSSGRGTSVRRAGHFGNSISFQSRYFRRSAGFEKIRANVEAICRGKGLELVHKDANSWNDFSDVDIVFGLREIGSCQFDTKPPTKLINAWLAGVPFIGGADSAYTQVGSPGFDYLRVTSREQLERAIEALKQDSDYFQRMVRRGAASGQIYRADTVTERWAELIESNLYDRFARR